MSANRLDDCGRCELLPTTTGWVRATQVRCPVHGSRPDALPADPTPPPVPAAANDIGIEQIPGVETWAAYLGDDRGAIATVSFYDKDDVPSGYPSGWRIDCAGGGWVPIADWSLAEVPPLAALRAVAQAAKIARAAGVAAGRTAAAALPDGLRGDGPCADCGTLDNIVWFTESVFWNDVVLRDGADAILCIPCFVKRVDATGYYPTGWRLVPDFHWETKAERAARIAGGTETDATA
jgi:hypothetical protein